MKRIVKSVALTFALALSAGIPFGGCGKASTDPPTDSPTCNPMCVTTRCSQHSDCTASPGGKCNFACPGVGCCVYD